MVFPIYKIIFLVFKTADSEEYKLLISAHNYNFKNSWSGEWLSLWDVKKESNYYEVSGHINLSTYYYEDGNVQFKLNNSFSGKTNEVSNDKTIASEVIALLQKFEDSIQIELDKIYDDLSENYLKPLRRKIPITGQRMNWNLNQIAFSQNK